MWTVVLPDNLPGFLNAVDKTEQVQIAGRDHSFFHQKFEIHQLRPVIPAKQQDGKWFNFVCLHQGERFKQLIQSPESTREYYQRAVSNN